MHAMTLFAPCPSSSSIPDTLLTSPLTICTGFPGDAIVRRKDGHVGFPNTNPGGNAMPSASTIHARRDLLEPASSFRPFPLEEYEERWRRTLEYMKKLGYEA